MLTAAAKTLFHPAPAAEAPGSAVAHAAPGSPVYIVLASSVGVIAASALARVFPAFCAEHALALSMALYLVLACQLVRHFELSNRHLLYDGRWLGYCSKLIGMVSDLEELAAVEAHATGRGLHLVLRTRNRELLRLKPIQWHGAELRQLLAGLLQARPEVQLDDAAREWLRQGQP